MGRSLSVEGETGQGAGLEEEVRRNLASGRMKMQNGDERPAQVGGQDQPHSQPEKAG